MHTLLEQLLEKADQSSIAYDRPVCQGSSWLYIPRPGGGLQMLVLSQASELNQCLVMELTVGSRTPRTSNLPATVSEPR